MDFVVIGLISTVISSFIGISLIRLIEKHIEPFAQYSYDNYPNSLKSRIFLLIFNLKKKSTRTFQEQISDSIIDLKKSSTEIDRVIKEISDIGQEKQKMIESLEKQLTTLEIREKELNQKIDLLSIVPVEVLGHFESILKKGDRKSANRDYILFVSGVILSAVVAIILTKLKIN